MVKRLRIYAGPNGSGKTTLAYKLIEDGEFKASAFINADEIEEELKQYHILNLEQYQISTSTLKIRNYFRSHGMSIKVLNDPSIPTRLQIKARKLLLNGPINSYIAADIAAFIRQTLLEAGKSFWFETVFSHHSKLELMKQAKRMGFRVYLYFIATESPEINISRVKLRVKQMGHDVPEVKIRDRYHRSLKLLLDAIKLSDRAYIFDNSSLIYNLVCEITDGTKATMRTKDIPLWFYNNVYKHLVN